MLPVPPPPNRRLLMSVDMQQYSQRDNIAQYRAQQVFREAITQATAAAGLDRSAWHVQQGGDSELAILPPDTSEPVVLDMFAVHLNRMLRQANRGLLPETKVRLRMAVHEGLVHLGGANGYPGDAVNFVCRLRDASILKRALAAFPDACLAVIVSDPIYRDVVAQQYEGIRSDRFRKVDVHEPEKGFRAEAWMCVVDEDVRTLDLTAAAPSQAPEESRDPGSAMPGTYNVGTVHSTGALAIGANSSAYNMVRPEEMP